MVHHRGGPWSEVMHLVRRSISGEVKGVKVFHSVSWGGSDPWLGRPIWWGLSIEQGGPCDGEVYMIERSIWWKGPWMEWFVW